MKTITREKPTRAQYWWALLLWLLFVALLGLGCSTTDRRYTIAYDLMSRQPTAGIEITPGTGRRTYSAQVTRAIDWNLRPEFIPQSALRNPPSK